MLAAAPAPESARYEVKFASRASELPRVMLFIRDNPAGFRTSYAERQVNNVYFDTFDQRAYAENLAGVSRRAKVRFRWYEATDAPEQGVLEIKHRCGRIGWKDAHPLGGHPLAERRWIDIRRAMREQLGAAARLWLDAHPQPVLINRYRRRYFVSGDGRVRVTLDWAQRFFDQMRRSTPNFTRVSNAAESLVVEFKFSPEDQQRANRYVQGIPLRLSRNSKYALGVQFTREG